MKKILVLLIMLSTFVIVGVLYGTSSTSMEEETAPSLEGSYAALYSRTVPDMLLEPMTAHILF